MIEAAILVIFPLVVTYAAFSDLFTMTIANRVSLILIGTFFVLAPFVGLGLEAVLWHVAAASIVFGLGFFCFAMGWVGGGDVKFATAVTLWLGWGLALEYFALFALFGGLLTFAILMFRGQVVTQTLLRIDFVARLHDQSKGVPYGISLAVAAMLLYPESVFMKALLS
jgi:prepilin peptidase CpaA